MSHDNTKINRLILTGIMLILLSGYTLAFDDNNISTDLLVYFPTVNGTGTTLYDYSGLGNNGTFQGSPVWNNTDYKIGGYSLMLDPVASNHVDIPDSMDFDGLDSLSATFWINPFTLGEQIVLHRTSTVQLIYRTASVQMNVWGSGSVTYTTCTDPVLSAGVFNHLAYVWNGTAGDGKMYIYLDGVECTTYSVRQTLTDPLIGSGILAYGCSHLDASCSNGLLDDFRFYNKSLSSSAITEIYNSTYGNIHPYVMVGGVVNSNPDVNWEYQEPENLLTTNQNNLTFYFNLSDDYFESSNVTCVLFEDDIPKNDKKFFNDGIKHLKVINISEGQHNYFVNCIFVLFCFWGRCLTSNSRYGTT